MIPYTPMTEILGFDTETVALIIAIGIIVFLIGKRLRRKNVVESWIGIIGFFALFFIFSGFFGGFYDAVFYNSIGFRSVFVIAGMLFSAIVFVFLKGIFLVLQKWVFRKRHDFRLSENLLDLWDSIALAVPLGIGFFRLFGCFINGHVWGTFTSVPWALQWSNGAQTHPVALYYSIFSLCLFLFLKKMEKSSKPLKGELTLWFISIYSIGRFLIDFLRVDEPQYILMIRPWLLAVGVVGIIIVFVFKGKHYREKKPSE